MTLPDVVAQAAFPNKPLDTDANAVWTDLVFRRLSISRGRSREVDTFDPGTLQIILDNRDRRYEPEYVSGAYHPNIKPNRRVRVRATISAQTFDLINAYADSWDQNYGNPLDATCVLSATDGFKLLNAIELPAAWDKALAAIPPDTRYRMDEQSGTTMLDSVGAANGIYVGAPDLNQPAVAYGTVGSSVAFDGTLNQYAKAEPSPLGTSSTSTAITLVSSSKAYNLAGPSSLAVGAPAGIAAGQVLIAFVEVSANRTITTPSDWSLIRSDVTATTTIDGARMSSYYRVVAASEPSSYTWTFSGSTDAAIVIGAFSGVNTTTPVQANAGTTSDSTTDTTVSAPTVTPTSVNATLVTGHGVNPATSGTARVSQSPPSGMTEISDTASQGTGGGLVNRATVAMMYKPLGSTAATGTQTSTMDENDGRNVGQALVLNPTVTTVTPTPFTVGFWFTLAAHLSSFVKFVETVGTVGFMDVRQLEGGGNDNKLRYTMIAPSLLVTLITDQIPALDTPHLVIARYDGDLVHTLDSSFAATQTDTAGVAGSLTDGFFRAGWCASTMDEVVVWRRYLSDDEVATLMAVIPGTKSSTALVTELLDYADWPTDLRSIQGTGVTVSNLTSVSDPGSSLLAFLQGIATTERAAFFVNASGEMAFETHDFLLTDSSRTTVGVTFGSGAGEVPYRSLDFDYSDQPILNEVRATNTTTDAGAVDAYTEDFGVEDIDSREEHGRRTLSLDLNLDYTAGTRSSTVVGRMNYELDQFAEPHLRITSMTVGPFTDATHWPTVLALDIGSRVQVNHVTPEGGTISQDLTIEGITHDITPDNWEITFALSSGGQLHPYWNLGETGFSELGVTTYLGW
jgi:hypothetical protein